ncbi:MAG: UDP-glucose--hexose-1-phosphate uridylyltransferase [Lachnospiraceae bacterium]|nr:UDP-glucose--hexose-1-phosphate uridylyltransferase [Lachnospiraceae bacterium]
MKITDAIQALLNYAVEKNLITADDTICARNQLMDVLRVTAWETPEAPSNLSLEDILAVLINHAIAQGIIEDTTSARDRFDTKLMGLLTPMPREVIAKFRAAYEKSPEEATDWYYRFSRDTDYVRAARIARDVHWVYESEYGPLDITINRSKPEKDPRDIAAAKLATKVSYPACQLCIENTGFAGTVSHPARQNLRPVPMTVNGSTWYLQYSPYGYYNEHCIVFRDEHIPMQIDDAVFEKLFDVLEFLPHYFIGSNADLPIVGGSILSHEHFQGGHYTFAMETAPMEENFVLPGFENITAGIVKWPMSVIRLQSNNRGELSRACAKVLHAWRAYTDEAATIFAETDGTPHNTITPIARRRGELFECDLVLRNNLTTEDRPLGLYHPNPSLHHIKKENIGLIEVMGLAVLPGRLSGELGTMAEALLNGVDTEKHPNMEAHAAWLNEIRARRNDITPENADRIVKEEIGAVFAEVLADAGVFKRDAAGREAFLRFIGTL